MISSLSEYGCNTNTRTFEEVGALYNTEMTGVYSGGLVYEYSNEASNYGLVEISGSSVKELPDFSALMTAYKNTPNPQGDGGYNSTGGASGCPVESADWQVGNDSLPAIPAPAQKYMTSGAGKGPGLTGAGSQNAGVESSGTATQGSGNVAGYTSTAVGMSSSTGTSSSSSSSGSSAASGSAASGLRAPEFAIAPVVCGLVVVLSTAFGAFLL